MGHRSEIEDGMGFAGLVPSAAERAQERVTKASIAAAKRNLAEKVLDAINGERLHDNLDNDGDRGYMRAIQDVTDAVKRVFAESGIEVSPQDKEKVSDD